MLTITKRERIGGVVLLLCLIVGVALFSWQENYRAAQFLAGYEAAIKTTHNDLAVLKDLVTHNSVTFSVSEVAVDCKERSQFEDLLGKLDTSTDEELAETRMLYFACRDYYPQRMYLMSLELERRYGQLVVLHTVESEYRPLAKRARLVEAWGAYIEQQKKRARLMREQSNLQGEVIDALMGGNDVTPLLLRVREVNESLGVASKELQAYGDAVDRAWDAYSAP